MLSLEKIMNESKWVVKFTGWRNVYEGRELDSVYKQYEDDEYTEIRDVDLLVTEHQPEELRPFFDAYHAYSQKHGWITIPDYYPIWVAEQEVK